MSRRFCTFAGEKESEMVIELVLVWVLAVVSFFVLWAILAKVTKRISERKHKDDVAREDADPMETTPEQRD
jgi:flagellar biosynthesis/type III secretory pathway M-ring protein FliF/YscJ